MFEFGTIGEIFIIACATLLLLGPKEIPVVLRKLGQFIYKVKKIIAGFENQINPYIQEGEFEQFKKENNLFNENDLSLEKKVNKGKRAKKSVKNPQKKSSEVKKK